MSDCSLSTFWLWPSLFVCSTLQAAVALTIIKPASITFMNAPCGLEWLLPNCGKWPDVKCTKRRRADLFGC